MKKALLYLFVSLIACSSSFGQGFNVKELLTLKDHDIEYFHDFVKKRGYTYDKSKYDEKREAYTYMFLSDLASDLNEITYAKNDHGLSITYGTTDVKYYEQLKKELEVLEFRFVKFVPKQSQGRSVLMIVYTDGHTEIDLYNAYIENDSHDFVRYYKIRVK